MKNRITHLEYIEKIKKYLSNKKEVIEELKRNTKDIEEGTEVIQFYFDLQDNYPYYDTDINLMTEEQLKEEEFIEEIRMKACELAVPFEDYTEADEKLLELMKNMAICEVM